MVTHEQTKYIGKPRYLSMKVWPSCGHYVDLTGIYCHTNKKLIDADLKEKLHLRITRIQRWIQAINDCYKHKRFVNTSLLKKHWFYFKIRPWLNSLKGTDELFIEIGSIHKRWRAPFIRGVRIKIALIDIPHIIFNSKY